MVSKASANDSIELHAYDGSPAAYNDNATLARTGKAAVLQRNFGFVQILAFSLIVLSTWLGSFGRVDLNMRILGVGLANGGPAGLIYSFAIVWIGNLATFTSLAELASMAPTAGGQYHWVSILAPPSSQKLLSYITGWMTVCGWQASVASSSFVAGLFVQGLIELVDATYVPQLWQSTLLMYGTLMVAILATTFAGRFLPMMESILLVVYIIGFFAILIPMVYLGPHASAKEVFTTFINEGGWSSQGVSFFVGISGNAFAFLGADSVYHMSEEIRNAPITVPKSMIWSLVINGVVGLAMYIAILFSAGNLTAALDSKYTYAFIEVLLQATKSEVGTALMLAIMIVVDLGLLISIVAASSRMLWSFARDRGVPGWRSVMKVTQRDAIPLNAILLTIVVSLLLGLISVGSTVAFNDAISLTVVSLYASYFMACALLLYRRVTGSIVNLGDAALSDRRATNVPGAGGKLTWGPWKVREPFGTLINAFACGYLLIVFVFSFFPPSTPVTPDTMNYACLVWGGVAILSGLYYVLVAHKTYQGPVVDDDRLR